MRTCLSTIHQTLTLESATVLNHSIAEAGRRNHGQTTPLHVTSSLLSSPSGFLRQACIRSHPNSSHPLQCRALELCFSVALNRLPTADSVSGEISPTNEPPISNALMAALKRAQAHQRRGCPEQQQQPLLAVKVELEQLVVSILDDPSVSRVMREAGFSSLAVKAALESSGGGEGRGVNPYMNPRLNQGRGGEDVKRVVEIMSRAKRRNPVLVGDYDPDSVVRDVLRRIGSGEEKIWLGNVEVVPMGFGSGSVVVSNVRELGDLIEGKVSGYSRVAVDLGDLKWVVDEPSSVVEIGNLLRRFGDRIWLLGSSSCQTYLRCQVYHPSIEIDWDLQPVPITSRSVMSLGLNGNSLDRRNRLRSLPGELSSWRTSCCLQCMENCKQEFAKLIQEKMKPVSKPSLPQWLQKAKSVDLDFKTSDESTPDDQEQIWNQKTRDLHAKWADTCLHSHPHFHHNSTPAHIEPKLDLLKGIMQTLQFNSNPLVSHASEQLVIPSGSPVTTELALGRTKTLETVPQKARRERSNSLFPCIPTESKLQQIDIKLHTSDSFKRLQKSLLQKIWWQESAVSAIASILTNYKLLKKDKWLIFMGPDRVGKRKMSHAISELTCGNTSPAIFCLDSRRNGTEPEECFRGKTTMDRIAEAVVKNAFSVIVLEDIDKADGPVCESIRRAMEIGKVSNSHGREVSVGNVVFVLTSSSLPECYMDLTGNLSSTDEGSFESTSIRNWQLRLSVFEKSAKRGAIWAKDGDRYTKPRREFDLNNDFNENLTDGNRSRNSSDITVDHEDENVQNATLSARKRLIDSVSNVVVFKPVDFGPIRRRVGNSITEKFSTAVGGSHSIDIDDVALDKIVRSVWDSRDGFEDWTEKVLVPKFYELKSCLGRVENRIVRVEIEEGSGVWSGGDLLPNEVKLVMEYKDSKGSQ